MADDSVTQALLSQCEVQIANYREYRQRSGADFNIFKIVNRATDEVHGHSAFIAELLKPTGSHGQGRVFLDLFFEVLGIQKDVEGIDHWQVAVEASRDVDGRIDILLLGQGEGGRRFGIAIENKIYANDERKQLSRYWQYLNNKYGDYSSKKEKQSPYLLYYLTLGGYEPSDQSIANIPVQALAFRGEENERAPVRLLSYADHVVEWINICHEKVAQYPYAREVMAQYLDLVNSLTGNGEGMMESLQSLLDTPEKLYAAAKMSDAVTQFKQNLLCDLWDMISKEWDRRVVDSKSPLRGILETNKHAGNVSLRKLSRKRFSKARVQRYFGLVSNFYEYNEIPVGIEIRFDDGFYVGLYGQNQEEVLDKDVVEFFYNSYERPEGCERGPVAGKIYITTPFDFSVNSEDLFKLVQNEEKEKLVSTILNIAEDLVSGMNKNGLTATI